MGWEWHRRLQLAEEGRMSRMLKHWDVDKHWEKEVMACKSFSFNCVCRNT